ncbi:MAG: bifunctional molybdenum cofactor biosynthesis protein MoaC/MoaB [Bacteroidetes bacterium]|nr:bifunctional molybdenum cofactor biosynthesis protein MoaC/MoaB [Bacteroidota bacterium]MDA1269482.1 bifunctional molybdenum cofactor biosynthesis protein MoaC/MoaB [Bacteroidota bacterium]
MVPITHKSTTLRKAIAQAIVRVSKPETVLAIRNRSVPKGEVLECARVAGLFAAKRTADMIPDCHPLPIEYTAIRYELGELDIQIQVEIHTIYKTGVEVEAMHAASVVALTMYDMLKPIDKGVSIEQIKLLEKKGGKSDRNAALGQARRAAILVCSDTLAAGQGSDRSGEVIREKLVQLGITVEEKRIVADEVMAIQEAARDFVAQGVDLLLVTGGTGLSPRDVTPEALEPLLDRRIPGVEEAIRAYGQQRLATAMLSRSLVGQIGKTLVLALPGSPAGAAEGMDAVFPALLHAFSVLEGARHS